MKLHFYEEVLNDLKETRVEQIMMKLELKLFRLNEMTDDQKKAMKEAEKDLLKLIK